jgi:tetratricopeptide (TPR) repeat protein
MRRVFVLSLVLALTVPATAQPPIRSGAPAFVAAERAWNAAERERDPARAAVAWQLAAIAFDRAAAVSRGAQGTEAAYSAVLAWKNATREAPNGAVRATSRDLAEAEQGLVHAIGRYLGRATSADDSAELRFVRASVFRRHGRTDEALPDLMAIVTDHPETDVAEFSANLLLDTLNVQRDFEALAEWIERMHTSPKLLAKRPALTETVGILHVQVLRKRTEKLEAAGRAGDPAAYLQAGRSYLDLFTAHPDQRGDELLFNAAVCFEQGGALADARKIFREVIAKFPKSRVTAFARARLGKLGP